MTSLLTINHYIDQVNNFIDAVEHSNGAYYVYAARPNPWLAADGSVDETNVVDVNSSVAQIELDTFNDLIFGKAVANSDIIHVIPRKDWTVNSVYDQYDQNDANLYSKDFYVLTTPAYGVYKCIFNNNRSNSTVKPTLILTDGTFETSDGYVWKYMYTVDPTANTKFTSSSFIPVTPNTEVQGNAIPGTIDVINIANGGLGYDVFETGVVQAIIDRNTIKISNTSASTNGYYNRSSIYLKSGFGAGQVREITGYNGVSKTVTVADVDLYTRFDLANASFVSGGGAVGQTIRQTVDTIATSNTVGYFSSSSNVRQSDTGIEALVVSANSTSLRVFRYDTSVAFSSRLPIRDTSDTGALISTANSKKVNISTNNSLFSALLLTSGSGYTGNATVTITSNTGTSGAANATANSIGRITAVNISSNGSGYLTEPTVTVSPPTAQTFNANTAVTAGTGAGANNVIALATAPRLVAGDLVSYSVSPGNTAVGGLTSGAQYYIQFANVTHVALSLVANTDSSNRIALTKGPTQTGHSIQGQTATARIFSRNLLAVNAASGTTSFTTDFPINSYIRVGQNANNNIRRVSFVNSTSIAVDIPFINTEGNANTFKLSTVTEPLTIGVVASSGLISNSTVDVRQFEISNFTVNGASFIVGERVQAVDGANTSLGANGTVSFANNLVLVISGALGSWASGQKVLGLSSLQRADIDQVTQEPSVTVMNPNGQFTIGFPVTFTDSAGAPTGNATLADAVNLTAGSIDYEIGPTVSIVGDGSGALAVAEVDTSAGTANAVSKVTVINPGNNYTEATIQIYANTSFGNGASATATIAPLLGHGADPINELNSRYAAITTKFDTMVNESYFFPTKVSYRKIGVLKDPMFANAAITLQNFNAVNLTLLNASGTWTNGEVVIQQSTNAAGVVVSGNTTSLTLRDTVGDFILSTNNTLKVQGYSSGAAANVSVASVLRFTTGNIVIQEGTDAKAVVVGGNNTTIQVSNVIGRFANGLALTSPNTTSKAVVNAISIRSGSRNVTTSYGTRFNQTARLTFGSNTSAFANFELITQANTSARARVLTGTSDLDLTVTPVSVANFSIGDVVTNQVTNANGTVIFANSTFVRLTAVSNVQQFAAGNRINSISANADIANVHSVLVVYDVSKFNQFTIGNNQITGANSGAVATCIGITNPDLLRESGKVIYTESSNTVIDRDQGTTEEIRLVIKF
jgi:hypothetical protein